MGRFGRGGTAGAVDLGDGITRPIVARVDHEAESGFAVTELVMGRHAGQVQDGATFSMFAIRYSSGASGVNLYDTLEVAREAAKQEAAV